MNDRKVYLRIAEVEKALRDAKKLTKKEKIQDIVLDRGMIVVKTEGK